MATINMKQAQALLFGEDGLRASNFKIFPGHSRDVTSDQIAAEIARVIVEVGEGKFERVGADEE
jgi:hypothetical protein